MTRSLWLAALFLGSLAIDIAIFWICWPIGIASIAATSVLALMADEALS